MLFTNGREDTWINPQGQFAVLRAAAPVYRLLGAGDFGATEPPPNGQLIDGTLGYFLRPGGHSLTPEDWKAFLEYADKQLGTPERPRPSVENGKSSSAFSNLPQASSSAPWVTTPRWEVHEFVCHGACLVENPFLDTRLVGEFISPLRRTNIVDGFYDGDNVWRLRFAPGEEGEWSYRLRGEGVEVLQEGRLLCTAPLGHGFIRKHPQNPYAFACADGTPFFPMGDTCYGLFDDSPITPRLREEYLRTRRGQHFNFVRMTVGHSQVRATKDPAFWAWGGTAEKPDLNRFNPAFFHAFDDLILQLRACGMNVELILLNFYRAPFTDTRQWTPSREQLWLRYLLARYGAFDHIFLWTLANEYETHPDGKYQLDLPADVVVGKSHRSIHPSA